MTNETLWSVPVRVEDVPAEGQDFVCTADQPTRERLARAAGLVALRRLDATFRVDHHGRGGLRVNGTVSATVVQTCVVTLEPLTNEIVEDVDLVFDPAAPAEPAAGHEQTAFGSGEPPEPLVGGAIDLGAIATEFLMLGIDPYPRKPGAVFSVRETPEADAHPFAALAALKKRQSEED
ncbi:MAG: DUF177 domain-containing protein [Variibacter sp.]|nr:DUF177 domain-containing protein [Variibacter sp.]